ncbi:hypothetical protein [Subtercola sp. RTI3]|uniref:hypothetical protein n=1 Tax=Subtercola sp. RTI3 TaxID=3048639 RepID=UPI002B2323EB|nr:hypothetical protein [Subtercola sp. RTI3]MEA9983683.1 YqaJ viral recombinase family protein [Subtercola sp. RTI3]
MSYLDRVLHDGEDRDSWLVAREPGIGASDAAHFARMEAAPKYVDAKLKPSTFRGNETTENGHIWEPDILAWVGIRQNKRLFHHPDEIGFTATPDGVIDEPHVAGIRLAEIKVKHNKIVYGPTPAEFRQVAWQLLVLPEAHCVEWAWGELVRDSEGRWILRDDSPKKITYWQDDAAIVAAQKLLVPIATAVLAGMRQRRNLKESAGF